MRRICLGLCLLLLPNLAFADDWSTDLRCKNDIVSTGASTLEVVKKCGEPASKETGSEYQSHYRNGAYGREQVEYIDWLYNFGPNDFIYTLRFKGGTLAGIKRGNRGF